MNVSKKLLAMIFTGFMLVHNAQPARRVPIIDRNVAVQTAQAATQANTAQATVATGGTAQPQDIQKILNDLREVKKLQAQLSEMPQTVITEILTRMNASPDGLTVGQVRSTINKYLRGSVAPAGNQTAQPAQQTKTALPTQATQAGRAAIP